MMLVMQLLMFSIGLGGGIAGHLLHNESVLVIGHIWMVGSIVVGCIYTRGN